MPSKRQRLADVVDAQVAPGMHLHFASTPSRSNASILQVVRRFRGTQPGFVLSTTGFHSLAHLLPLYRLGRRYVSCFFGDNFPIPRPNDLYTEIHLADGVALESWSLWTFVAALRAGALGDAHATNHSLASTTLGAELARAGRYAEVGTPAVGLIAAMRPDIAFLHALMADEDGRVVCSPPFSEGFHAAMGAKHGAVITVERIVDRAVVAAHRDAMPIDPDRVLAVCEEPFGAHPQPLYALPRFDLPGYRDDFAHYELWRALTASVRDRQRFETAVLDGPPGELGDRYRVWVGTDRLRQLVDDAAAVQRGTPPSARAPAPRSRVRTPTPVEAFDSPSRANEIMLLLGARKIAERVVAGGYHTILAGIGHGFIASRLAKLLLQDRGIDVKVMVETGLYDLECGPKGHSFPLAFDNIAQAGALSSVENVLGIITRGATNTCLGVLGAGQIDPRGNINSTRTANGKMLVGSGGAHDIAAAAGEVVVLTRHSPTRMVNNVDYVTSSGARVACVVTNLCAFARDQDGGWVLQDVYPALGGEPIAAVRHEIRRGCPWNYRVPADLAFAPLLSTAEMILLHTLDQRGAFWEREVKRS